MMPTGEMFFNGRLSANNNDDDVDLQVVMQLCRHGTGMWDKNQLGKY